MPVPRASTVLRRSSSEKCGHASTMLITVHQLWQMSDANAKCSVAHNAASAHTNAAAVLTGDNRCTTEALDSCPTGHVLVQAAVTTELCYHTCSCVAKTKDEWYGGYGVLSAALHDSCKCRSKRKQVTSHLGIGF